MSSTSEGLGPYVGSMMRVAHQWVLAQIYEHVVAAGYDDLGRAQVGMFRYPTPDGLRPSELADLLQITKQSVNDLLREMERLGYLILVPDPTDGRARIIRLTEKGHRLHERIAEGAKSAELMIAELLGPRRFAELRHSLEEVVSHIAASDPPNGRRRVARSEVRRPASD